MPTKFSHITNWKWQLQLIENLRLVVKGVCNILKIVYNYDYDTIMIRQVYLVIRFFVIHSTLYLLSYMCLYLNVYNILAEQRSIRDGQAMFDINGGDVTWPLTQHLRSCVVYGHGRQATRVCFRKLHSESLQESSGILTYRNKTRRYWYPFVYRIDCKCIIWL